MGHHSRSRTGSRIQPLAFSKELLPVGSRLDGGDRAAARGQRVSGRAHDRIGGADKICFVISPGKSDILEYYGGRLRRGGHLLRRAAAARRACATRFSARCPLIADRRAGARRPARHDLVSRGRACAHCPTTGCRSCCSRWSARSSSTRSSLDERRQRARDPGQAAGRRVRTGSGARSRCRARVLHELARALAGARARATNISARWSTPGSRAAAARTALRAGTPMSTSAR